MTVDSKLLNCHRQPPPRGTGAADAAAELLELPAAGALTATTNDGNTDAHTRQLRSCSGTLRTSWWC